MELTYLAHSCFKLSTKNLNIIIDPYEPTETGYKLPKQGADVVLVTHEHFDHNYIEGVSDYRLLINSPGEYEVGGVFVQGFASFHDDVQGELRGKNTMYLIDIEGVNVLHLGDLGHLLDKETVEKLPDIDVLLVPVGGTYTIDAKLASKVVADLAPTVVVPMHYQTQSPTKLSSELAPLSKFLEEMGAEQEYEQLDVLKMAKANEVSEDTKVVVLTPKY
ncbi:MAG: MBL fold metallo-hydrolase [Patescibacteria group bacterium]|uniref:MBL fold metallo-hydrolase n=1 Tax=candidate division WWE3 bacterium TaxID=2053526 RepID=A0A955J2V6_UNCKA|nr:MBL fold metallo-hydrolase [candidate division WWE3 bacterium]